MITSGSMTGTYDRGSLVYDEVVPVSEFRVGDVITFTPPRGSGPKGRVTHRIFASFGKGEDRTYNFKLTSPSGSPGNSYQGASTSVDYVWSAVKASGGGGK